MPRTAIGSASRGHSRSTHRCDHPCDLGIRFIQHPLQGPPTDRILATDLPPVGAVVIGQDLLIPVPRIEHGHVGPLPAPFESNAPLDGEDIPRFGEKPLSPAQGLAYSVTPAVMLLIETLIAFLFAVWAVNRADITGYAMSEES